MEPGYQSSPPSKSQRYRWLVRGLVLAYLAVMAATLIKWLL
jgi:hypothetical protein